MNAEKLLYNMALASILKEAGGMDQVAGTAMHNLAPSGGLPGWGLPPGVAESAAPHAAPLAQAVSAAPPSEAPPPGYQPPAGQPSPAELSQDYMGAAPTEAPPAPQMRPSVDNAAMGALQSLPPGWGLPPGILGAMGPHMGGGR